MSDLRELGRRVTSSVQGSTSRVDARIEPPAEPAQAAPPKGQLDAAVLQTSIAVQKEAPQPSILSATEGRKPYGRGRRRPKSILREIPKPRTASAASSGLAVKKEAEPVRSGKEISPVASAGLKQEETGLGVDNTPASVRRPDLSLEKLQELHKKLGYSSDPVDFSNLGISKEEAWKVVEKAGGLRFRYLGFLSERRLRAAIEILQQK